MMLLLVNFHYSFKCFDKTVIMLDIFQTGVTSTTSTSNKVVKVVKGNQSHNHCKCNRSDILLSIDTTGLLLLLELY